MVLTADFHDEEAGLEYETPPTPGVPGPDALGRTLRLALIRVPRRPRRSRRRPVPFARRALVPPDGAGARDPLLHLQCVAYLSDHGPTRAARQPHATLDDDGRRMSVSLDHSVWLHRPADVNQWLRSGSSRWPPAAGGACRWARSAPSTAPSWRPSLRRSSSANAESPRSLRSRDGRVAVGEG